MSTVNYETEVHITSIAVCESPNPEEGSLLVGVGSNGIVYKYVYEQVGLQLHFRWKPLRMSTELGPEPQ